MRLIKLIREKRITQEFGLHTLHWVEHACDIVEVCPTVHDAYSFILSVPFSPDFAYVKIELKINGREKLDHAFMTEAVETYNILKEQIEKKIDPRLKHGSPFAVPEVEKRYYARYYLESVRDFCLGPEPDEMIVTLCDTCVNFLVDMLHTVDENVGDLGIAHALDILEDHDKECDLCKAEYGHEPYVEPLLVKERERRCEAAIHIIADKWSFYSRKQMIELVAQACTYGLRIN